MKAGVKTAPQDCYVAFFDGSGMRPDGSGSGYSWFIETTGKTKVKRIDGLTNNQAEYRGFLDLLKQIPEYAKPNVFSDSQLVVNQFNGKWKVHDPELQRLLDRVREVIEERHLMVTLKWIPRAENLAGKLL